MSSNQERVDNIEKRLNLIPEYGVVEEEDPFLQDGTKIYTLGPLFDNGAGGTVVGTMENMLGQIFTYEYDGEFFSAFLVEAQQDLRYLIDRVRTLEGSLQRIVSIRPGYDD